MLRILAAFIFFTRLPFWRLAEVPAACFKNIVSHWALVGWLTAGLSVLVLYATSLILPPSVAILCAMITRLLITGCLHEDGLADFFDGFGGGTSRERILARCAILAGDPFCKGVSSMIINRLPYARKEEEAKNKTVYSRMTSREYVFSIICAFLPLLWLPQPVYLLAGIFPVITWYFLTSFMKRKIQGYTGDCCGATFLLCELSFYMGFVIIYQTI